MVAQRERLTTTVEDYLALEEASPVKHQYVDGQVQAVTGGTVDHDRIANMIRALLDAHLADGPCAVLGPDVRLRVSPTIYYYPDAFVTCDAAIDGGALEVGDHDRRANGAPVGNDANHASARDFYGLHLGPLIDTRPQRARFISALVTIGGSM